MIYALCLHQRYGSFKTAGFCFNAALDLYLTDESAMPLLHCSITPGPTPGHVLGTARRRLSLSSTHHFRNEEIYSVFGST
jgi:hypothetical protein